MGHWASSASLLLVPVLGCSATVVDEDEVGEDVGASSQASVTVERTVTLAAGEDDGIRTYVSARFVQVAGGIDHEMAARVVGVPRDQPATGTCEWRTPSALQPLPEGASEGSIELLDVGDVVLHAGVDTMPLAPRAFPDVGDIVSGVLYTSRGHGDELPAGVAYEIETTGSDIAAAFRMRVDAPPAPQQLRVGAAALQSAEVAVVLGEALQLQWLASDRQDDRIVVDLSPVALDGRELGTTRCTFEDEGSAVVPDSFVSWAPEFDELEISVHRQRRSVVKVAEIDEAVVEFDFAVVTRVPVAHQP